MKKISASLLAILLITISYMISCKKDDPAEATSTTYGTTSINGSTTSTTVGNTPPDTSTTNDTLTVGHGMFAFRNQLFVNPSVGCNLNNGFYHMNAFDSASGITCAIIVEKIPEKSEMHTIGSYPGEGKATVIMDTPEKQYQAIEGIVEIRVSAGVISASFNEITFADDKQNSAKGSANLSCE